MKKNKKTFLVTGGTGFIGSSICELLVKKKYSRCSFGIPKDKFVFCHFNNDYKIDFSLDKDFLKTNFNKNVSNLFGKINVQRCKNG